jgi:predicted secreted protein
VHRLARQQAVQRLGVLGEQDLERASSSTTTIRSGRALAVVFIATSFVTMAILRGFASDPWHSSRAVTTRNELIFTSLAMNNALQRLACMVVVVAAAAASAQAVAQAVAPSPPLLGVLGLSASASVEVTRDVLVVTLSSTREGADAGAVQAQLKQALDAALAEARKAARPGQLDVQTGNFSIYPRYATNSGVSGRATISGWQGSAELVVEGHDMAAIGQLTGRISTMTIAGVGYRLSREASQKVEGDVAAEAIARYRAKAADYAKQFGYAGYSIREVNVSSSDATFAPQPALRMQAASESRSEALSVEPGKATVTATVNGTVQMK